MGCFFMLTQSQALEYLIQLLAFALVLFTSIPVHEVSHGLVAYWLGDPTAKNAGRLTLNPFKHFDLFGTIALFLVHVGWAKPVPIDPRYFKKPKLDIVLVSLAGPLSNFILAFFAMIGYKICFYAYAVMPGSMVLYVLRTVFYSAVLINITLMIFNLLPIPPNDGFKILGVFLPQRTYFTLLKYERYGMIIIVVLLLVGALQGPLSWLQSVIANLLIHLTGFVEIVLRILFKL